MPSVAPAAYRLRVDGLVAAPKTFTLADLKAMPRAEQVSDFHCVTGWVVKNVRWAGVRIADVLEQAGAKQGVSSLRFVSAEVPYEDSLTLKQALLPDVMLAYEMDGKPLSRPHGAPVRLVMPRDVRVQERQVGQPDRAREDAADRLLGAERLRRRCLARPVEWLLSRRPHRHRSAPNRIQRFTRTERVLHWTHATAFFTLLATGLILYLPALSTLISRRQLVKNVHIWVAVAWAIAIVVIIVAGNRKRLAEDWREIETIDRDDRRWLTGRRTPQGRFNAGQKINALLTVAFALLFALSGFFLWLGERDHRFIFDGTGTVHDILTFLSVGLLVGHLYLALIHPSTRHALRGITTGEVDESWARKHHAKWVEAENRPPLR